MKILITGSKGAIGRYVVDRLLRSGHNIMRCDIVPDYADNYIQSDVTKPSDMEKVFVTFQPEITIHLAALYGRLANEKYASLAVDSNVVGTSNIVQLCKTYNSKLIFTSSSEVYGNCGGVFSEDRTDLKPNNRYGMLKLMCEQIIQYEVREHGLQAIIIRPNMVYSEHEPFGNYRSALIRFCETLLRPAPVTVYKNSTRSWLHISDFCDVIEKLLDAPSGTVMNVGHPDQVPTINVATWLCEYLKRDPKEFIIEEDMPLRMTLQKPISIVRMYQLMGNLPKVHIEQGCIQVLEAVKKRMGI